MAVERVGVAHPECCEANNGKGQCEYRRAQGSRFCQIHAGGSSSGREQKKELLNLRINNAFGVRAGEIHKSNSVKNLTDEIALMRVTLETMFNTIQSGQELLLYVDKIDKLTNGIQKLVESWQKIQEKNKELLGRETVMAIFDQLIELIVQKVKDPDIILELAEESHEIVTRALQND